MKKVDSVVVDLSALALHLDEEFYPCFLTVLSSRRWLLTNGMSLAVFKCLNSSEYPTALAEVISCAIDKGMQVGMAGIIHGREKKELLDLDAYDPSAVAYYLSVVQALADVEFSLLSTIKSNKDVGIAEIMDLLWVKGPHVNAPMIVALQPDLEQLLVPIYDRETIAIIGAGSLSRSLEVGQRRVNQFRKRLTTHQPTVADVYNSLVDPLSARNVMGTKGLPVSELALVSTTSSPLVLIPASVSVVPARPFSTDDYDVGGTSVLINVADDSHPEVSETSSVLLEANGAGLEQN